MTYFLLSSILTSTSSNQGPQAEAAKNYQCFKRTHAYWSPILLSRLPLLLPVMKVPVFPGLNLSDSAKLGPTGVITSRQSSISFTFAYILAGLYTSSKKEAVMCYCIKLLFHQRRQWRFSSNIEILLWMLLITQGDRPSFLKMQQ